MSGIFGQLATAFRGKALLSQVSTGKFKVLILIL
jgi:hypothetical protein